MKDNLNFDGSKAVLYSRANAAYCREPGYRKPGVTKKDSYSVTSKLPETPDPGCFAGREVRRG